MNGASFLMVLGLLAAAEPTEQKVEEEISAHEVEGDETPSKKETAEDVEQGGKEEAKASGPAVSGYVIPIFTVRYRPTALPRDTWSYGLSGSFGGIFLAQKVFDTLSANLYAEVGGGEVSVEQATLDYEPMKGLAVSVGRMYPPFTYESTSFITKRLFPQRASPTTFFLQGTDLGLLVKGSPFDGIVSVAAGVFNGAGVTEGDDEDRGWLYLLRADVAPWGKTPSSVDHERGAFRAGAGVSLVYYPSTLFDEAGYVTSHARDFRLSLATKVAFRGAALQAEYIRRHRSDEVAVQTTHATGWYVAGSYFHRMAEKLGIAPIARYGTVLAEKLFVPRRTRWLDVGLTFYMAKGEQYNAGAWTLSYAAEMRRTEGESAHAFTTQYLLQF